MEFKIVDKITRKELLLGTDYTVSETGKITYEQHISEDDVEMVFKINTISQRDKAEVFYSNIEGLSDNFILSKIPEGVKLEHARALAAKSMREVTYGLLYETKYYDAVSNVCTKTTDVTKLSDEDIQNAIKDLSQFESERVCMVSSRPTLIARRCDLLRLGYPPNSITEL